MRKNIFTKIAAVAAATVLAVTALPALVSATHAADDEYSYVYAGRTWQEYWANEGVYNAGDVTTSNGLQLMPAKKSFDSDWAKIRSEHRQPVIDCFANLTSVSYTHLDVYKRQNVIIADNVIICRKCAEKLLAKVDKTND